MSFSRLFLSRFASVIHFIIFTKKKLLFLLNQFGCSQFFALTLSLSDTSVTCDWLLFFCSCCPAFSFNIILSCHMVSLFFAVSLLARFDLFCGVIEVSCCALTFGAFRFLVMRFSNHIPPVHLYDVHVFNIHTTLFLDV